MTEEQHQGPHMPDDPNPAAHPEVMRINNDPRLTTGEKLARIRALTGSDFGRGEGTADG